MQCRFLAYRQAAEGTELRMEDLQRGFQFRLSQAEWKSSPAHPPLTVHALGLCLISMSFLPQPQESMAPMPLGFQMSKHTANFEEDSPQIIGAVYTACVYSCSLIAANARKVGSKDVSDKLIPHLAAVEKGRH